MTHRMLIDSAPLTSLLQWWEIHSQGSLTQKVWHPQPEQDHVMTDSLSKDNVPVKNGTATSGVNQRGPTTTYKGTNGVTVVIGSDGKTVITVYGPPGR